MQLGLIRQFDPHRREEYFTPLELSDARRLQHLFVIGRTGTGKSTALKNFILQDIESGAGCAFFDPHGIKALLHNLAGENQWKRAFLFKAEPSLGSFERAPQPALSLFTTGWDRVGNPPFFINSTEN